MKKMIASMLLAVILIMGTVAGAAATAPASIASDAYSENNDLIYVKKPEKLYDITTSSTYTISASAQEGAKITVYKKNALDGRYHQIFFEEGKMNTTEVGASGLYSISLRLTPGTNNFLLYAEGEVMEVQIVKVDITRSELRLPTRLGQLSLSSASQILSPLA